MKRELINLEKIFLTNGARECLTDGEIIGVMNRFVTEDFGDLCSEDVEVNKRAIECGDGMVMGSYLVDDEKIWVISYLGDGGYTSILLPEEY